MFDSFLYQHDLKDLAKEGTHYKNPRNTNCIDLYSTNTPISLQNTSSVFTGFSDFHKLFLTVFKTTFVKSKPKELFYRDYKHFKNECFEKDLKCALSTFEKINYQEFDKTFIEILNKHAPVKGKGKSVSLYDQSLTNMRRSELETRYFKPKTNDSLKSYKREGKLLQQNIQKKREKLIEYLNLPFAVVNKKFWIVMKPLFNEKK